MKTHAYDIIIVGGGVVGLTLAAALAKDTQLHIAVLESQPLISPWFSDEYHPRVSAIALSSQRIFKTLHVWDAIQQKRISPFTQIEVWDNSSGGKICFDGNEIVEPYLGYIIENNIIQTALLENIKKYKHIEPITSVQLNSFHNKENYIELATNDDRIFTAKLVVAADGAHSWLRSAAGISIHKRDYDQEAIIATVHTSLPHQRVARQVFLNTGPLAFLPLAHDNACSIVWSLATEEAKRLMALDAAQFQTELAQAFSFCLGPIVKIGTRYAFPLSEQKAEEYIKPRVALVGDAAHTIHPLAGQGVNMGMLDAASLAEIIIAAYKNQRDFASLAHLRRYERWRKADNFAMLNGVDMLKSLFASDKKPIQQLRGFGLNMTNRLPWIKNFFTLHAVGARAGLPKIAR